VDVKGCQEYAGDGFVTGSGAKGEKLSRKSWIRDRFMSKGQKAVKKKPDS